jgi:hypothetical protein
MTPRDTRTGGVLESMVLPALKRGGYDHKKSVNIGKRLGRGRHVVDVVARDKGGRGLLVSLKWQQVSGTAEQKVPFEVICLIQAVLDSRGEYKHAYLVLGGPGWTLREFYVGGGLRKYLNYQDKVTILSLEDFVAKANKGQL